MVLDDVLAIRSDYTDVVLACFRMKTFFSGISCYFFPGGWILKERGAGVCGLGKAYIWGVVNKEGEGLMTESAVKGLSGKVRGLTPVGAKAVDIHFQLINVVFVQLLSVVWLCNPMSGSMPGVPVLHNLPEFVQTHVHRVSDAIQLSHPLLSPSLPALNLSQHQGLIQWIGSSREVANVSELRL